MTFPPLFLSHGAPNMALHESAVRSFMMELGDRFQKPDAIVVFSAHFETAGTQVVTDPNPEMIYDFGGFEDELRSVVYPAPGEPELARDVLAKLKALGIKARAIDKRGYDHGAWVPLSLVWPDADIPIVQVSIDPDGSPAYHYKLGQALADLPGKNIAVIGTGNITHNLSALFNRGKDQYLDDNIKGWVAEFLGWFDSQLESGNTGKLLNYLEEAPFAKENHPTDEHLLPIFAAMGAAGNSYKAKKLHSSYSFDFLAMDAWAFHPDE